MEKERPKYTREGLPRVSTKVLDVLIRDLVNRVQSGEQAMRKFGGDILSRLEKDNPDLAIFYYDVLESLEDPALQTGFTQGFFQAYEALRKQAEANKMNEEFK